MKVSLKTSIQTNLIRAWQKKSLWLWIFLPLSWLYGLIILIRKWLYQSQILPSYRAPVPVWIVGNITVGGSGKTPLLIAMVQFLQKKGVAVGVISRGYGGNSRAMPLLVNPNSTPAQVGDEPCLIVQATSVPMVVAPNRQQAIQTLLKAYPQCQMILADDGLQHYRLQRDFEWIVIDADRGFGNAQLLPTGFLREPLTRLKGNTLIHHRKHFLQKSPSENTSSDYYQMTLQTDNLQPLCDQNGNKPPKKGDTIYAVSGIGYPKRFFDTLNGLGFRLIECPFADHHTFSLQDFAQMTDYPIIMTAKDAVKVRQLLKIAQNLSNFQKDYQAQFAKMWILPVHARLSPNTLQHLCDQVNFALSTKINYHDTDFT